MRKTIFLFAILIITMIACTKNDESTKITLPVSPSNLIGKALSSTSVNLSWSDNSTNETGFKIERKTGAEIYKVIITTVTNTETFIDTALKPNNTYVYRVFAFNSAGSSTTYSNEVTVTTDSLSHAPTVQTKPVSSITLNSAISGGIINSDGGSPVTSRGVVWSTSHNPTFSLSTKTSDSTGIGTFVSNITGLTNNTTYYVKAYATNSVSTSYGEEMSFKTSNYILPTTSDTISMSSITSNSAIVWIGQLITDGGTPIISRGVVWSTSQNPTISLSTKTSGTGSGWLNFNITNLISKGTYYIREYATNSIGTVYGTQISFITAANQQNSVIGDYYGGGIVFYILKSGDIGYDANVNHGLIATYYDADYKGTNYYQYDYPWGDTISTTATDISIGTGRSNTNLMISKIGTGYHYAALGATKDFNGNGFNDWYLPSKNELNQMYLNIGQGASGANKNIGGFSNSQYWSSSEVDNFSAYCLDFGSGNVIIQNKTKGYFVRGIRSF